MNIQEKLKIISNPIKDFILFLILFLIFVWIGTLQIDEFIDFIRTLTNHGDVISITAGMGYLPLAFFLLLILAMVIVIIGLLLIAKYTKNSNLLNFDPDKTLIEPYFPSLIKLCIVFIVLYFMLPIFSDKIAAKLGYRYFCPKPVETTYFESYLFYDFTYAKQPDLCPSFEDQYK
jgi:uncharacterized BrkB/YihY/UPF0761 family membrane protein